MTAQRFPDDLSRSNTEIGRRFSKLLLPFGRPPSVLSTLISRRLTPTERTKKRCWCTVGVRVRRRQRGTEVFHFLVPSARPVLVGSQTGCFCVMELRWTVTTGSRNRARSLMENCSSRRLSPGSIWSSCGL